MKHLLLHSFPSHDRDEEEEVEETTEEEVAEEPPKKRRGRPKKADTEKNEEANAS